MLFDATELFLNRRSKKKVKAQPRPIGSLIPPVYEEIPYTEFTDIELASARGSTLIFDIETYRNYFLIAFKCYEMGKVVTFEKSPDANIDVNKLRFVVGNFLLIGFNSRSYDIPMLTLALYGGDNEILKNTSDKIIRGDTEIKIDGVVTGFHARYGFKEFEKEFGFKYVQCDHIDLIDVAPLKASLKLYAGRLHCKRMQDLPYEPDTILTQDQGRKVRFYCVNDLDNTALLYKDLYKQIQLRISLSAEYEQDLRSRSDAQIAEHVIAKECEKINGYWAKRPKIAPGTIYHYQVPDFVCFQTPEMQDVLNRLREAEFVISEKGRPKCEYLNGLVVSIGAGQYRMGVGGLHSSESCIAHFADKHTLLIDRDVASFYPRIILNLGLFPKHLGKAFLKVYNDLVERRLEAKGLSKHSDLEIADMNKIIADSIKITINGSFGKLGSKWSSLYSPDLLIQVTLTGQLALLMLIEALHLNRIPVVSANTDGIVIKCPQERYADLNTVVKAWETHTCFETEETQYKAVYSRDVNNYIALKKYFDKKTKQWVNEFPLNPKDDDLYKGKGVYSEADIWKNPKSGICTIALIEYLIHQKSIKETIRRCNDFTKFVTVRTVKGGAEQNGHFIGKAVRWYYSTESDSTINYILSGNKVPESYGAKPCMVLPDSFPVDVNYEWYEKETNDSLADIGFFGAGTAREVEQIELFAA